MKDKILPIKESLMIDVKDSGTQNAVSPTVCLSQSRLWLTDAEVPLY